VLVTDVPPPIVLSIPDPPYGAGTVPGEVFLEVANVTMVFISVTSHLCDTLAMHTSHLAGAVGISGLFRDGVYVCLSVASPRALYLDGAGCQMSYQSRLLSKCCQS
jgi:hypothetical protein